MKIICSECKKEIDDTNKQCPNCGFKNKLNKNLYLKKEDINNCPKCGNKINKGEDFCTKCGNKAKSSINNKNIIELIKTIYKRNKKPIKISIIIILILSFILIDNIKFNKDIMIAEEYYEIGEYYDAGKIVDKYPLHKNNEFVKKYNYVKYLLTDLNMISKYNKDEKNLKWLIYGYSNCLEKKTTNDWEKKQVEEVKNIYYRAINKIVSLSKEEIEELCNYNDEELESKISSIMKDVEKSKTCDKSHIKVKYYSKSGYKLDVTLENNNGCNWNIKSYSEVRVYFTDSSYEDVYLSTNINLKSGKEYTFYGCYLGSDNKYKTISRVTFID